MCQSTFDELVCLHRETKVEKRANFGQIFRTTSVYNNLTIVMSQEFGKGLSGEAKRKQLERQPQRR